MLKLSLLAEELSLVAGRTSLLCLTASSAAAGAALGAYQVHPLWLAIPVAAGSVWALAGKRVRLAILLGLLPVVAFGYALWRQPHPQDDDLSRWVSARGCVFRGKVLDAATAGDARVARLIVAPEALVFPRRRRLSGKVQLSIFRGAGASPPAFSSGDRLQVACRLSRPPESRSPWQFDSADSLRRQGIYCLAVAPGEKVTILDRAGKGAGGTGAPKAAPPSVDLVTAARSRIISCHKEFAGNEEGELLSSMVLGDRAVDLSATMRAQFRAVGLSHLLAASGLNLTIVTGMAYFVGRVIFRATLAESVLSLAAMASFVILAGPSPSVVRAALMCTTLILSRCLYRTIDVRNSLAFALALSVLSDPVSVTDVGMQLSYVATAGIIFGIGALSGGGGQPSRGARRWLVDAVLVIVVAQMAVLPLQLLYFWQIGLLFLPANLLVAPLVPLISIAGFASSIFVLADPTAALGPAVAGVVDRAVAVPLSLMLSVVRLLSSCDWSIVALGPPGLLSVFTYYGAFCLLIACLARRRRRLVGCLLFVLSLGFLVYRTPLPPLTVAVFPGTVVAVDGERRYLRVGERSEATVARFLKYHGVKAGGGSPRAVRLSRTAVGQSIDFPDPAVSILVADCRNLRPGAPCDHVRCDVLVVLRGPGDVDMPDPVTLADVVRASGARRLVVDWAPGQARRSGDRLRRLTAGHGVETTMLEGGEAILVFDGGGKGPLRAPE